MSEELKVARILFIIGAVFTFIASAALIFFGILVASVGMAEVGIAGGLLIFGGIIVGVAGGLKIWCANLVKEERKLTTAGVLGIVLGIISPGIIFMDILTLIGGILVVAKKDEVEKSKKKSSKKSKKKK